LRGILFFSLGATAPLALPPQMTPLLSTTMTSGLLPDASAVHLEVSFTPDARGTRPPVEFVKVLQLNPVAPQLTEFMSRTTAAKAIHPLIKLHSYNGFGSLETFFMKFQHMAIYLQWDDDDMFHHLCVSLEGAAAIDTRGPMSQRTCLLYPPSSERYKSSGTSVFVCRRSTSSASSKQGLVHNSKPNASKQSCLLQSLYQDICRLVTLAYPSADTSLTTYVGKEAFITALSDGNLQLEVMKQEPPNVEVALSHAIKVEAYEQSLACQGTLATEQDDGHTKCRSRNVFAVSDQSDSSETAMLWKWVEELQEVLEQATKRIATLATGPWSGRAAHPGAAAMVDSSTRHQYQEVCFQRYGQGSWSQSR